MGLASVRMSWPLVLLLFAWANVVACAYSLIRFGAWPDAEQLLFFAIGWFSAFLALDLWRRRRGRTAPTG